MQAPRWDPMPIAEHGPRTAMFPDALMDMRWARASVDPGVKARRIKSVQSLRLEGQEVCRRNRS